MFIIDRRLNPGGKSLVNRQRFLRRAKSMVQRAVRDALNDRSIKDLDQETEVSIVRDGVHEPTLHRAASGGDRDHILPGNKEYVVGDTIPRPPGGSGSGAGTGDGEDEFRFVLSREEFLELFLDDLELPDMIKKRLVAGDAEGIRRAGYARSGSPSNLSVTRTMRHSLSRRIALRRPGMAEVQKLEEEIARVEAAGGSSDELARLRAEHDRLLRRRNLVAFIDPIDLRYRRYEPTPKPVAQAVMFCLMDRVRLDEREYEGSGEALLRFAPSVPHPLLPARRAGVHPPHRPAEEVDEQTFFYSQETGGTLVSSALEQMLRIARDRYRPEAWNIYVAQASDGDNMSSDNPRAIALLQDGILPICQYFAYLEVKREGDPIHMAMLAPQSELWRAYEQVAAPKGRFVMRAVHHRAKSIRVLRELFQRQTVHERTLAS
jgi:uncharacterized sporulation protein YeaH/YhbH (DUF444 family)